jgi:hypothetical protein
MKLECVIKINLKFTLDYITALPIIDKIESNGTNVLILTSQSISSEN